MELTWGGYRITLRVQQERVGRKRLAAETQGCEPKPSQDPRDVQTLHSLAGGSRYVAPSR